MVWRFPDSAAVFFFVAAVSIVTSVLAFRGRRHSVAAGVLSLLMFMAAFWTLFYILELSAVSRQAQILANNLSYIPIVTVPVLLLIFSTVAGGHVDALTPGRIVSLFLIPVVLLLLVWTSSHHRLFYSDIRFEPDGDRLVMTVDRGVFYWVYIAYAYACIFAGTVVAFNRAFKSRGVFRFQAGIIAAGTVLPWMGSVADIIFGRIGNIHFLQLAFMLSGILYLLGIVKFNIAGVSPIGREALLDRMEELMVVINRQYRVVDINLSMEKFLGRNRRQVLGEDVKTVFAEWPEAIRKIDELESENLEVTIRHRGKNRYLNVGKVLLKTRRGIPLGVLLVMSDITRRMEVERNLEEELRKNEVLRKELREQAIRDPLTGVYNRRFQEEITGKHFARILRQSGSMGFMFVDIDHFKNLNDKFGHQAGDAVLVRLAGILLKHVRESDIICRYGGEEFLLVFPDAGFNEIYRRAEQMREEFENETIRYGDRDMRSTFSAGIGVYPSDGDSAESAIGAADRALYTAKNSGRNQVYHPERRELPAGKVSGFPK